MTATITLITDFGTQDGYVGAMKGKIVSISPTSDIIDVTHDISPQSVLQAAYCLSRSVPHFPPGTIHVVVVDPGVGSARPAILVKTCSSWLIGPDNGVFSILLEKYPPETIIRISSKTAHWQTHTSFDGLALFAPAAAHLAEGMPLSEIGTRSSCYEQLHFPRAVEKSNEIEGEIILFDRFGNAITNIHADFLQKYEHKNVTILGKSDARCAFQSHYEAGMDDDAIALINSDQLLELSVYCGSMQQKYDLVIGDKVFVAKTKFGKKEKGGI
ncbi:MAG: SAM-dependent chlorinase/fluorinase [SAR324 cluster bacterium]|nr:SAM-dependent chlorinase/fluorinase [SAR324 cluster bacterium]